MMKKQEIAQSLVEGLNPPQKEAVLHGDGPLLLLAGAGSGKTRVITHRIAYLVEVRDVDPKSILAITFTNKAANEMRERIRGLIGDRVQGMWVGTFHSMMVRILRRHAGDLGYSPRFTILDTDDQLKWIKLCMKELNLDEKHLPPRATLSTISGAKNRLKTAKLFAQEVGRDYRAGLIAKIYQLYEMKLKQADAMDFDDILLQAVRLLQENREALHFYRQRFRYVLVDEYQDTNHAQYRLIHLLCEEHKNLCVVGDDDQSIYAFRGADLSNILDFEKDYPEAKVIKLEQNYRSTAHILEAANAIIANNKGRKEKALWTEKGRGEPILWREAETQQLEAKFLAADINRRVQQEHSARYGEMAILYRMNALSRSLEFALRDYGIPHRIYGGLRFYDRQEVKDILAYCRLVANPSDLSSFTRILNVPRRGIGEVTQEAILQLVDRQGLDPVSVCRQAASFPELHRAVPRLLQFADLMDHMGEDLEKAESFAAWMDHLQNATGLIDEIQGRSGEDPLQIQNRLENLRELISDCVEFEKNPLTPDFDDWLMEEGEVDVSSWTRRELLDAYLERTALASSADLQEEDDDHVRLMTVHSAKGLEFDIVYLVGLEEGIFPGNQSLNFPEQLEEERRLAYVAVTRARKILVITTARQRLLYGRSIYSQPSRFLREMPQTHLKRSGFRASSPAGERGEGRAMGGSYGASGRASLSQSQGLREERQRAAARLEASAKGSSVEGLRPEELAVGMKIEHPRFGEGEILQLTPTLGDAIVLIDFDGRQKRLMAKQAKLKEVKG